MKQLFPAHRLGVSSPFSLFFLAAALLLQSLGTLANTPLAFQPQKPRQGEKVLVRYNPAGTPLDGVDGFEATAYLFDECHCLHPEARAEKLDLKKTKDGYEGYILTSSATNAIVVKFSKDAIVDNNGDKGYVLPLYTSEGKPVQGANLYLSHIAGGNYAFVIGVKANKTAATRFAEEEFALYPSSKNKYVFDYVNLLLRSGTEEDKAQALKTLEAVTKESKIDEERLQNVQVYYQRIKDGARAEEVKNLIRQKFPQGEWQRTERASAFFQEKDLEKKAALFAEFLKAYPPENERPSIPGGQHGLRPGGCLCRCG